MAIVNKKTGEIEYEGQVFELFCRSCIMEPYDQEYWAWIYDGEKEFTVKYKHSREIENGTAYKEATIDITPELQAKREQLKEEAEERKRVAQAEREAKTPRKGKIVKVVRGRKVPKGTIGTVKWTGQTRYGDFMTLLDDGKWVKTDYLEVIQNPTKAMRLLYG